MFLWLIGNFTLDTKFFDVQGNLNSQKSIGGAVAYAGAWIAEFKPEINGQIFSAGIPSDLPYSLPYFKSINQSNNPNSRLTTFKLIYKKNRRKLILKYWPDSILSPLKSLILSKAPDIIFFLPVYHEINPELITKTRSHYPDSLLVVDPQGWLRKSNAQTNIIESKFWNPSDSFLQNIDIIKFSSEDINKNHNYYDLKFISRILSAKTILIITLGKNGLVCWMPDQNNNKNNHLCYYLPASTIKSSAVLDQTGAGDVTIISFTTTYFETRDIHLSLAICTVMAALLIQSPGLTFKKIKKIKIDNLVERQKQKIKSIDWKEGVSLFLR